MRLERVRSLRPPLPPYHRAADGIGVHPEHLAVVGAQPLPQEVQLLLAVDDQHLGGGLEGHRCVASRGNDAVEQLPGDRVGAEAAHGAACVEQGHQRIEVGQRAGEGVEPVLGDGGHGEGGGGTDRNALAAGDAVRLARLDGARLAIVDFEDAFSADVHAGAVAAALGLLQFVKHVGEDSSRRVTT